MPIFTFHCRTCGEDFEKVVQNPDIKSTSHAKCGRKSKRSDKPEVPARRNPDRGIQR